MFCPQNHDTPLHIAAAMGRRKLTKIFMQNGAEPAIKNKVSSRFRLRRAKNKKLFQILIGFTLRVEDKHALLSLASMLKSLVDLLLYLVLQSHL